MSKQELLNASIWQTHQAMKKGEFSSLELCQASIDRIKSLNPKLNAIIHETEELALDQAKAADKRFKAGGDISPLNGIPVTLKDIFLLKGVRTTCGSHILENFIPPYTATSAKKLLDAGVVHMGKANMDEFAMGSSTENSYFGVTRNPWNVECIPGGSSGGSAASVSAKLALGSLGTDTGGSIRQPAALCGVSGIKPTYGRVSRYGVIAFASSLDQVGPFGKDVKDCALLLQAISGHDPHDSTSANQEVPDFSANLDTDIDGMQLGLPEEYWLESGQDGGIDPEVLGPLKQALEVLEKRGAKLKKITLPHTQYAVATYYIIAPAEASSNLARYDGVRYGYRDKDAKSLLEMYEQTRADGFGDEVQRRIMIGTYALSAGYYDAYYLKAQQVRALIRQDFDQAFKECQAIITPTSPCAAFRLGEKVEDPLQMYLSDIFTISCNLAGLPGMSIPCGFTSQNLPVGLQILGKPFDESTLFQIGSNFQKETDWHLRSPELSL